MNSNHSQNMKLAILGWGSLISKPEGDASIGQKPLHITGKFVSGGPLLPIEFSRISQDGRLTLVIDPVHGTSCETFYAISSMPDLASAVRNLAEREGTPATNIHFASRYETYTDEIKSRIAAWLIEKGFDAAVWTGLPPKFQFQSFQEFSTTAAIAYLKSLTGETRVKALNYINSAPPTVNTPVRDAMMKQNPIVAAGNIQPTKTPELTPEERSLIAALEPIIRKSVYSKGAKVFEGPYESSGKWIEYPLRLAGKFDFMGEHARIKLTRDSPSRDFTDSYCAFGSNKLHTSVAVYRILRELKALGLLNASGFDSKKM